MSNPDSDLVSRCDSGDAAAIRELYAEHRAAVARMVRLQAHPASSVEDLVQDTFVRALEQLGRFRGDAPLITWLRGIALNLSRTDRVRLGRRRALLGRATAGLPAQATDIESQADGRGSLRRLQSLMQRLSAPEREAFALRSVERVSLDEAAAILGASVSTVSDRDRRAQKKLRDWLEEETR